MNDMGGETQREQTLIVVGNSMLPTLRALDTVIVIPCIAQEIRPGDVIVFPSPKGGHKVIHRVVWKGPEGLATRGDNSLFIDKWVVCPEDVIGTVKYVRRGKRQWRIYNGSAGNIIGRSYYNVRLFVYRLKSPGYYIYKVLCRSGIFKDFLPESKKPKVLSFKRPDGVELHLVMGKKIIGTSTPGSNGWVIRFPYRLFVDDAYLDAVLAACETHPSTEVVNHA